MLVGKLIESRSVAPNPCTTSSYDYLIRETYRDTNEIDFEVERHQVSGAYRKEQGETYNGIEYSKNPSAFPINGEKEGIWYVKKDNIE